MSLLSRLAVQAARAYGILSSKSTNISASYLVVAGGGGGGSGGGSGGGGGAGGLLTSTFTLSTLNTYSIAVGSGGAGAVNTTSIASSGTSSSISGTGLSTVTTVGGGGGASDDVNFPQNTGGNGGSGGGGGGGGTGGSTGGTGTAGQGNNGGYSTAGGSRGGGGGGGSGSAGSIATNANGANGGSGTASSISGSSVTYAGGGGGGTQTGTAGTATGGGGAGSVGNTSATAGTANTGGGGGGRGFASGGAAGGSGIVIISYASATPKFVGGTLTTSGGNQIHTFTSSGTLSPLTPVTASYLVVAGGGGGGTGLVGQYNAGGGGAGGLLESSTTLYSGGTYVVTVGAGGATNTSGSNSVVSGTGLTTVTSTGGGRGGTNTAASTGGSGGGGASTGGSGAGTGATGTSGQGFAGGNGAGSTSFIAGGGGGAGEAGNTDGQGEGGDGVASSISGTSVTYAGGGGGAATSGAGGGGAGGGGAGSTSTGVSGTTNLGGGGGGGAASGNFAGGSGGSGVVIISYAGSQVFNGGLVTSSGGNTIHTFTATGALTPLTNNLNNSLRFRNSASASLTRTPTIASNRRTFTLSMWVKRGLVNAGTSPHQFLYSASTSTTFTAIDLYSNNIRVNFGNGTYLLVTSAVYRDPSAWYHIVLSVDTTQATDANRVKLYINGNQQSFASGTYPTQNYDTSYNNTVAQRFGVNDASDYFDGYMTDINFIDGQALEPYYFGNNDANGVWKPIKYTGTYGTNGFYLTFGNTTSTTTLGYDSSPNGNNWTCNNISLTAGSTYDAMKDVPTNTSATVANYAVMNPLNAISTTGGNTTTLSNANLSVLMPNTAGSRTAFATIGVSSGKWYWETTITTGSINTYYPGLGIDTNLNALPTDQSGGTASGYMYLSNGQKFNNGSLTAYGSSFTTNDVIGVALDMDAGTITFYKNNTSQGQAFSGITGTAVPCVVGQNNAALAINFGQRPFQYSAPSGFLPLNTFNLP